jgi:hypothetical protein
VAGFNAMAEAVIGLEAVEFATLTWVDWFNDRGLLSRSVAAASGV